MIAGTRARWLGGGSGGRRFRLACRRSSVPLVRVESAAPGARWAAGGGCPEWDCACRNCRSAREETGNIKARTQESVAVSADGEAWFLLNCSPEIRAQNDSFPPLHPRGCGTRPSRGACSPTRDLDHTLGLLCLRESQAGHDDLAPRPARGGGVGRRAGEPHGWRAARARRSRELIEEAHARELYTNLITSGIPLTRERLARFRRLGLDNVQLSIQDAREAESDAIAGLRSFERKLEVARSVKELGFPLTVNTVLHRGNLDRIGEVIALAEELRADWLELANAQYLGWALENRRALLPTRSQLERARSIAAAARGRLADATERTSGVVALSYRTREASREKAAAGLSAARPAPGA